MRSYLTMLLTVLFVCHKVLGDTFTTSSVRTTSGSISVMHPRSSSKLSLVSSSKPDSKPSLTTFSTKTALRLSITGSALASGSRIGSITPSRLPQNSPKSSSPKLSASSLAKLASSSRTAKTQTGIQHWLTTSSSSASSTLTAGASSSVSTSDDYANLTSDQKQQIAFDISINFATQLALWDFQTCVTQTAGYYSCALTYSQRNLGDILGEFRPIGNYDTFSYDEYGGSEYYGLQAADLLGESFGSSVVNSLLMGCFGNITCQYEYAKRPTVYTRVATDIVKINIESVVAELTNKTWIPSGFNAKYLKRFAYFPDYQREIYGVHAAIPLAILAGYLDRTAFATLLRMDRIMAGQPQVIEDSINTIALLGLHVPSWNNINVSVLSGIYSPTPATLDKRTEVDWFNVDPSQLLKQMKPSKKVGKRDQSGIDEIKAVCAGIGLATNLMSIRGILKSISSTLKSRASIATFNNAFGAYDSSENLLLGTITSVCAQPRSSCYGGSNFWQYTSVAGDAVDIVAGYIGLAGAATALVGASGVAAAIGAAEFGLNTLNFGCGLASFAFDVARAIMTDCQNEPSLPECTALANGCLIAGSVKKVFGV